MQRRARDEHGSDRAPSRRASRSREVSAVLAADAGYGASLHMSLVVVLGSIGMAFSSAPRSQPRPSELYPAYFDSLPSMAGKTVVITGASRGLGYVTALAVARKGAAVFMVGRRSARADEALEASASPAQALRRSWSSATCSTSAAFGRRQRRCKSAQTTSTRSAATRG